MISIVDIKINFLSHTEKNRLIVPTRRMIEGILDKPSRISSYHDSIFL